MTTTKIDLDELERKARAAEQSRWTTLEARGRMPEYCSGFAIVNADGGEQIADAYDNTTWPDRQCIANAANIAANSPPVTLALVERIRELEAIERAARALIDEADTLVHGDGGGRKFYELVRAVESVVPR